MNKPPSATELDEITGLCSHTSLLEPGEAFVGLSPHSDQLQAHINSALSNGASHILVDECQKNDVTGNGQIPIIGVDGLRAGLTPLADKIYGYPQRGMDLVGVTGTNGKTTICYYVAQALANTGYIGTLGYGDIRHMVPSIYTTPDGVLLRKLLAKFKAGSIRRVAMEVSSHALAQGRVDGLCFKAAVLTNITQDHLDYHADFADYVRAKQKLFYDFQPQLAIINLDDPVGANMCTAGGLESELMSYSLKHKYAHIYATDCQATDTGVRGYVHSPWGEADLALNLFGLYNMSNALAVLAILHHFGMSFEESIYALSRLEAPPGRMTPLYAKARPRVFVDYAHTPDALANSLTGLPARRGKLWCVFGCGGERDQAKRALMGEMAERYCDKIVLTNDNPRHEDPDTIIEAIISGIKNKQMIQIQPDRELAIRFAIEHAHKDDIIVVCGKGHEPYQLIGDERLAFSDIEVVKSILRETE